MLGSSSWRYGTQIRLHVPVYAYRPPGGCVCCLSVGFQGFIEMRCTPWIRALITRLIAIVPALLVAILTEEQGVNNLIVLSQVLGSAF